MSLLIFRGMRFETLFKNWADMLLGHTKATTTGRYGILPEGILSERVKMIEAVEFPGL
jgi:hypothetical protein